MSVGGNLSGPISYLIIKSRQRDRADLVLKVAFLSLQLADFALTLVAARYGYPELNPLLRTSVGSLSLLAIFKFAIPVAISWFVPGRWLVPAILLLCGVVGWNIKELLILAF